MAQNGLDGFDRLTDFPDPSSVGVSKGMPRNTRQCLAGRCCRKIPVDKVEVTLVSRAEDSTLDTPGREEHLMPWLNDILHKGSADES